MLDRAGVPITDESGVQRSGVSTAVRYESTLELVGQLTNSAVGVTMLADDFAAFEPVTLNKTNLTIGIGGPLMTIVKIDKDPTDPCVNFFCIGRH